MLQQILQDMYVEPELLNELDEEQKQILFCKMREEQLRRWARGEKEHEEQKKLSHPNPKPEKRRVKWLLDKNGAPWTWVMGEHPDDPTIDDIIEHEAQETARILAESEAEELRRRQEEELKEKLRLEGLTNASETIPAVVSLSNSDVSPLSAPSPPSEEDSVLVKSVASPETLVVSSEKMPVERVVGPISTLGNTGDFKTVRFDLPEPYKPLGGTLLTKFQAKSTAKPADNTLKKTAPGSAALGAGDFETRKVSPPLIPPKIVSINNNRMGSKDQALVQQAPVTATPNSAMTSQNNPSESNEEVKALLDTLKRAKVTVASHRNNNDRMGPRSFKSVEMDLNKEREALEKKLRVEAERRIEAEKERRQSEIYQSLKEAREQANIQADLEQKEEERYWAEQEKKAREAEDQIRNIARQAREQHRQQELRTSTSIQMALEHITHPDDASSHTTMKPLKLPRPPKPKSRGAIVDWFVKDEAPRGTGLDPKTKLVAPWFHGIVSREDAESMLNGRVWGSFLVRVSERIWGFTLSFSFGKDKMKHFLIERTPEGYQFLGTKQIVHRNLWDLISYHESAPITAQGEEILRFPVGQSRYLPDYQELFPIGTGKAIDLPSVSRY